MKIAGLQKKRQYYYYQPPQVDGIRPGRVALRTTVLSEAVALALQIKAKSEFRLADGRLSGELDRYLRARAGAGAMTPRTVQSTKSAIEQFIKWAGDPLARDVEPKHIEAWRVSMAGRPASSSTTYLQRLRGLFAWLVRNQRLADSPFAGIQIPRAPSSDSITFCTREQRDALITKCDREDLRFYLMCGFYLGMRRSEIIEARPEWFRTPGLVEVAASLTYTPKNKRRRIIHYGKSFADFLRSYGMREPFMLRPDVDCGRSFYRYDPRRPFEEHVSDCGLEWVRSHTMRHTFATLHIQAGTPLATVAQWLGDSYEVTYRHYAAYAPSPDHITNID